MKSNIKNISNGQWPTILTRAGIDQEILDGKHHPCPACGGKDRFRFDDLEGRGTFHCNQCGAGDGFELLQKVLNSDFPSAVAHVESVLGVKASQGNATGKRFIKTPADAVSIWPELPPANPSHPYLKRKGIQAHIARQNGEEIIIPVYSDLAGTLVSVQRILPKETNNKFFIKGTDKKGNFCLLGNLQAYDPESGEPPSEQPILFCEGFATGASIHEATGFPVVVCFDSGNLAAVAEKLKPEIQDPFIFCADNDPPDEKTGQKPGEKGAQKARAKAGGAVVYPKFPNDEYGDFNDLALLCGLNTVKAQITSVIERVDAEGEIPAEKPRYIIHDGMLKVYNSKEFTYWTLGGALEIVAATKDERGNNHGRLLRFKVRGAREKELNMPMSFLAGETSKLAGVLLGLGYWLIKPHVKHFRDTLADYISSAATPKTLTTTDATGWHGGAFVLTGGEVIGDGEKLVFIGADTDIYAARGTLDQWRRELAALAVGNSRLEFAVSLAFAGVLMPLAGDDGAGCNFFGISSTGKTTTQVLAASVWGSTEPGGFISKWNATATGLEIQALMRNHALFCIDELGEVDPKIAGRLIYQLASGVQKGRGRAGDNGIGLADAKTWKMPFISSAEKTLAQHIEDAGQRLYAGQSVRCVDIPADAGAGFGVFENLHGLLERHQGNADAAGAAFSDLIKDHAKQYHGTAGRAFVAALLKVGIKTALGHVADVRGQFSADFLPSDASGLARRAAKLFSLTAAAGELAVLFKILPWEKGAALTAAGRCFTDWLQESGAGNPEERAALSQVQYFLESNRENFRRWHEADASDGGRNIPRLVGYMPDDESAFYVLPEIFKRDACKGYSANQVIAWLEKRGMLETAPGRKQLQIRPPKAKKPLLVYSVKSEFAENELHTVHTVHTNTEEANKNNGFGCKQSVISLYANHETVSTVCNLEKTVYSKKPIENNVVSSVYSVSSENAPDGYLAWQVFVNDEPAYPARDSEAVAKDDLAMACGFKSWAEMRRARVTGKPGVVLREVTA
jgi:putative DNA primase/helicase